jgi:CRISPR-associated protein Cas2
MFILVAYDIADDKRRRKVAKLMEDYGARVQLSAFECNLRPGRIVEMIRQASDLIKPRYDKIQVYFLCGACRDRVHHYAQYKLTADAHVLIC